MKKLLMISAVAALLLAVGSCDDDDNVTVNDDLAGALAAKYPGATNIDWERQGAYTVADFDYQGHDMEAWFDSDDRWVQSETDYNTGLSALPEAVYAAFTTGEYAAWTVDDVSLYDRPDKSFYVIGIERVGSRDLDVYYQPDGTLIQAIPDTGDILPSAPVPAV